MKILSAQQIREADAYTIANEPIASIDLMERASLAFTHWFVEQFDSTNVIKVFCGTGNNGGDGLAVARLLSQRGYHVETFVVRASKNQSDDFGKNFELLSKTSVIQEIKSAEQLPIIEPNEIVIDALFGSGLTRPVEGLFATTINQINNSGAKTISIDIPSGLYCDDIAIGGNIIAAVHTISFQTPKLAFFLPDNYKYVGNWHVVAIGLDNDFIEKSTSNFSTIEAKFVRKKLLPKLKTDHKGTNGRALLIVGSYGKMGAAILAGNAAMRSGLGLLTIHTPHCGYNILQTAVPEAMVSPDIAEYYIGEVPEIDKYNAIGIGSGIDTKQKTIKAIKVLLEKAINPMVIDADAINILAAHPQFLSLVPKNSIITPHYKEFERLVGTWKNDLERIDKQVEFAKKHKLIVVFKGANTTISIPKGNVYFNTTGNPGMATGGSGDVLTGIMTGILAQGYTPLNAAIIGVYIHGLAGDYAANKKGMHAMIASDIIAYMPQAFMEIV